MCIEELAIKNLYKYSHKSINDLIFNNKIVIKNLNYIIVYMELVESFNIIEVNGRVKTKKPISLSRESLLLILIEINTSVLTKKYDLIILNKYYRALTIYLMFSDIKCPHLWSVSKRYKKKIKFLKNQKSED